MFVFELISKPQKILRDHSLKVFNQTHSFLQVRLYLAICELLSSS
ncbi:hypothetical protein LEP1GSC033_2772 [Leptospira interrogans str. 2002000632]|uniref:SLEI domain protein, PF07620 family n=1 Tax=Leptospira interrogans serovar Zanoni str. LT2156 TaxID=1001601 RepID=M6HEG8_LEPIR|nr:hypothetical protein LEP1GSC033_2772 [Leptospira interrogans str. 2002000632]EMM95480.1 hypothetical protein LEP1GSC158_0734 [Leptospira interrogans serovar Zanoni str. LT2156]